jgi:penicillin-binding protein 2
MFYGVATLVFAYLICGLFYRQIIQHRYFQQKESRQNSRRIVIPGMRGNIYDRNGVLLAGHRSTFSISLYLHELYDEFRETYLKRANTLRQNNVKFNAKELRRGSRVDVVKKYLDSINETIGSSYAVSSDAIEKHLAQKFLLPMKIADDISQEVYERLMYILPKNSPMQLSMDEVRYYPYGDLACHIIGYVAMDEYHGQSLDEKIKTFTTKCQMGKSGIELGADEVLRGIPGHELWQIDTLGMARTLLKSESPRHGSSIRLSVDKNLQGVVERALGDNRGCAIVMNVRNGEILAMTSKPSYNINLLIPKISYDTYDQITSKGGWLNLATQGKFPLGSVFKLVSSIAFLQSGEVLGTDSVFCSGVTEVGGRKFTCKNHTSNIDITFEDAIARSCNTFFYENAKKVKKDRLIKTAIELGFSEKTGIELPHEGKGFVPTEAWKKAQGFGSWVGGDTLNLSIGQGYLLVTPIEVCCFTSSIAANRLRTKPTIFFNGNCGNLPNYPSLGLDEMDYNFRVNAMVEVVENRSGKHAKVENLKVAGKTGTAQFFDHGEKRNLAWFTCFAPVDDPEIAVTVMVQEKSQYDSYWGGTNAAPIAKKIIAEYFTKKQISTLRDTSLCTSEL